MPTSISSTAVVYETLSFTYTDVYTHKPVTLGTKAWNWNGSTTNGLLSFTDIPDWAVKVYVVFDRLSFTGAETLIVQIGDSGGIETSGYSGCFDSWISGTGPTAWTGSSAPMAQLLANGQVSGILTMTRLRAFNIWSMSFTGGNTSAYLSLSAGRKELSSDLTQLRITSVAGGSTYFNNGTVAVVYQ